MDDMLVYWYALVLGLYQKLLSLEIDVFKLHNFSYFFCDRWTLWERSQNVRWDRTKRERKTNQVPIWETNVLRTFPEGSLGTNQNRTKNEPVTYEISTFWERSGNVPRRFVENEPWENQKRTFVERSVLAGKGVWLITQADKFITGLILLHMAISVVYVIPFWQWHNLLLLAESWYLIDHTGQCYFIGTGTINCCKIMDAMK